MIEFKQIIGRGTRIFEGKDYFTIVDFYDNVRHFADPEWDGEPEAEIDVKDPGIEENKDGEGPGHIDDWPPGGGVIEDPLPQHKEKLRVKLSDGKIREIKHMLQSLYFDEDGKPMSAQQFIEKLFGTLPNFFDNEEKLRLVWSNPRTRQNLLEQLERRGFDREKLDSLQQLIDAEDSDMFDVLRYIAFAIDTITRKERVAGVGSEFLSELNEEEEGFVRFVLDKYEKNGFEELSEDNLQRLVQLKYGSSYDAVQKMGDADSIRQEFIDLQKELYEVGK
jgi:type I restriction enzyme, R subunit